MPVGVPEIEVFAAADRVLARGERPTTERVRAELGRGSPAWVGRLLEQWWDALSKRLAGESRLPELPPEVAAAFKTVWASASAHGRQDAEAALAEQQAQLQAQQAALNEARAQDAAEIAIAEQLQREANLARVVVEARLGDLQRQLDQQIERSADALRQRDQLQLRGEQLERDLAAMRATLQAQEHAAAAEREGLSAHVRAVEERMHAEVDRAREEAKGLRVQLIQLERERTQAARETTRHRSEALAALQLAERTAAANAARAQALEQQLARLVDLPAAWRSAQDALEAAGQREQALRAELTAPQAVSPKRVSRPQAPKSGIAAARRKKPV